MDFREFLKIAASGNTSGTYIMVADESYYFSGLMEVLESAFDKEQIQIMRGGESDGYAVAQAAYNMDIFSSGNVVVIKDFTRLKDMDAILDIFSNRKKLKNMMIFMTDSAEWGRTGRKKAFAGMKNDMVVRCPRLYEKDVKDIISRRFAARGKSISREGLELLVSMNESDLEILFNEVEKLIQYTEGEDKVNESHVAEMGGCFSSAGLFEMLDYMRNGKTGKFVEAMEYLIKNGDAYAPFMTINMIFKELEKIMYVKDNIDMSYEDISAIIKLHPYVLKIKRYKECAGELRRSDIVDAMDNICRCELRIKMGLSPSVAIIDALSPVLSL